MKETPGFVKITGGFLKGRRIATPGGKTHPMGERERIALFNMLGERAAAPMVFDAYCGGGTLGIEAISRGAFMVVFMDKSNVACRTVNENLDRVIPEYPPDGVFHGDIVKAAPGITDRFSIVFADPPYDDYRPEMITCLAPLVATGGGLLVASHPGDAPEIEGLELETSRKYAGATISIYRKD